MVGVSYIAEFTGNLTLVAGVGQIWVLPFLIYLNVVDTSTVSRWVIYAVMTLLLAYPNCKRPRKAPLWRTFETVTDCKPAHPIQVAWNSRNSNTVRSRTVSAACYNMFVQASAMIASNIYRDGKCVGSEWVLALQSLTARLR
jgi:hypothetical protein